MIKNTHMVKCTLCVWQSSVHDTVNTWLWSSLLCYIYFIDVTDHSDTLIWSVSDSMYVCNFVGHTTVLDPVSSLSGQLLSWVCYGETVDDIYRREKESSSYLWKERYFLQVVVQFIKLWGSYVTWNCMFLLLETDIVSNSQI